MYFFKRTIFYLKNKYKVSFSFAYDNFFWEDIR